MKRCDWAGKNPLMIKYHDEEWGVQLHDDRALFEFLCLEGAQAGLTWQSILNRREGYRILFDNFNASKIIKYDSHKIEELMKDKRIIRNRGKINAFINNASIFLELQKEFGSFDTYIWNLAGGPQKNSFKSMSEMPSQTEVSKNMSKVLKKRGFKFVGPTICYAFMQATGMVNDHLTNCFRYNEV